MAPLAWTDDRTPQGLAQVAKGVIALGTLMYVTANTGGSRGWPAAFDAGWVVWAVVIGVCVGVCLSAARRSRGVWCVSTWSMLGVAVFALAAVVSKLVGMALT